LSPPARHRSSMNSAIRARISRSRISSVWTTWAARKRPPNGPRSMRTSPSWSMTNTGRTARALPRCVGRRGSPDQRPHR
jgi:hypothetical protein